MDDLALCISSTDEDLPSSEGRSSSRLRKHWDEHKRKNEYLDHFSNLDLIQQLLLTLIVHVYTSQLRDRNPILVLVQVFTLRVCPAFVPSHLHSECLYIQVASRFGCHIHTSICHLVYFDFPLFDDLALEGAGDCTIGLDRADTARSERSSRRSPGRCETASEHLSRWSHIFLHLYNCKSLFSRKTSLS